MIVAETAGAYRFVTQPEHAELAGNFAERWGNDRFERPEPLPAAVLAAYRHDDGWLAYDRRPHLGPDGTPVDFREMPAEPWVDLYDEGIEAVAAVDPYAGLLVSMHGAGLRNRRYGLSPDWPPTQPAFEGFVARQEERQAELAGELRGADDRLSSADVKLLATLHGTGGPPEASVAADSRLWRNYELLQAWDTLSLSFCTSTSPPSYPEVGSVPKGAPGSEVSLSVEALGDGAFRVAPYPFEEDPLPATVAARTVRADAFEDEESLLRAYYSTDRETLEFELRS